MIRSICQNYAVKDVIKKEDPTLFLLRIQRRRAIPILKWLRMGGYSSMYKEVTEREPLNMDEIVLMGETWQKFRVGYTLIRYTAPLLATYVTQTASAEGREVHMDEPDAAVELFVYFIHNRIIDQETYCSKYRKDPSILWSLARIASKFKIDELSQYVEFLLLELLISNSHGISSNFLYGSKNSYNILCDFYLSNIFEFETLSKQLIPSVIHFIAQDRRILESDSVLKAYASDPKFHDLFMLLNVSIDDSNRFFTVPSMEYETDYYYEYYDSFSLP